MAEVDFRDLFCGLIDFGIRNLSVFRDHVNELNVFPVPDGDTGTNMLLTLENGFAAVRELDGTLSQTASKFAGNIVFGARGNSGVILSQFLKGFSERIAETGDLSPASFVLALHNAVDYSYRAVAEPVEGTMLTVMREATDAVTELNDKNGFADLKELIAAFIKAAKISLDNTPELLPVLKEAGVIDSGGAGLVYVFEGMYKYLNNEQIERIEPAAEAKFTDFSKFNRDSSFPLGYCTEMLLQLTNGSRPFDEGEFLERLSELGESIVLSCQDDHVKVHVHSKEPEKVLSFCHEFGEFLSLKIENMTVQHTETHKIVEVCPGEKHTEIGVVAVANDSFMREKFFDMGADVVINAIAGYTPSAKDFMDAFEASDADHVFVFPNYKNSYYAAEQAKELSGNANVHVFETKTEAECYAALAIIDFGSSPEEVREAVDSALSGIHTVNVSRAVKDKYFGDTAIRRGDYIAVSGSRLYAAGVSFPDVVKKAIDAADEEFGCDVITFFFGEGASDKDMDEILAYVEENYPLTDTDAMKTEAERYTLILSFE